MNSFSPNNSKSFEISILNIVVLLFIIIVLVAGIIIAPKYSANRTETVEVEIKCNNLVTVLTVNPEKTRISYKWIHSVELTPITEVYKPTKEGLILVQAKSESFGAGHPYSAEELGGSYTVYPNGTMVYTANYNIGNDLRILAVQQFHGEISVNVDNRKVYFCPEFQKGEIKILP